MGNLINKSCLVTITGLSDLLVHNVEYSLNPRNPWSKEVNVIAKKRGTNKTTDDMERMQFLQTKMSLWYKEGSDYSKLEIPPRVLRAAIEEGARKVRQGPLVREGLVVSECTDFTYPFNDVSIDDLCHRSWDDFQGGLQFETPVVVQRNKVLRVRARFQMPWKATFKVTYFADLLDEDQMNEWLLIAGMRLGIGDWRPSKSGIFGRFEHKIESVS